MPVKKFILLFVIMSFSLTFFGPAVRAQVCSPPPSGLVAWYRGQGDALDASGNGNHGNLGSASTAAGHVGQALNFTAQDQSVVLPNNASMFPLTALTIEGWLNPLPYAGCSGGSYRTFHTVQFTPLRGYLPFINCTTGQLIGALFDPAGIAEAVVSNAAIPADTFTHFAMTWDGSNLRIYLNGALDNTAPTTMAAIGTNTDPVRIGNATALGFRGLIDEISLYNRALSGPEVAAIFNAGTAGKCFAPSAAAVAVSGRAVTDGGLGVPGGTVTLTDPSGVSRIAKTNPFGYYAFQNVMTGAAYVIQIESKRYQFVNNPRTIVVNDELAGVDFTALP